MERKGKKINWKKNLMKLLLRKNTALTQWTRSTKMRKILILMSIFAWLNKGDGIQMIIDEILDLL